MRMTTISSQESRTLSVSSVSMMPSPSKSIVVLLPSTFRSERSLSTFTMSIVPSKSASRLVRPKPSSVAVGARVVCGENTPVGKIMRVLPAVPQIWRGADWCRKFGAGWARGRKLLSTSM